MLSHELRNPLSAALNASYLLDRADLSNLTPEAVAAARIVQRQTLQAARLLDDLLDVARVTQGKIEIRKQLVEEVSHLIEDAAQAVQPAIAARLAHRLEVVGPGDFLSAWKATRRDCCKSWKTSWSTPPNTRPPAARFVSRSRPKRGLGGHSRAR